MKRTMRHLIHRKVRPTTLMLDEYSDTFDVPNKGDEEDTPERVRNPSKECTYRNSHESIAVHETRRLTFDRTEDV